MQQLHKRVTFFEVPLPELPIDNTLMRRIFRPDEEAPARCSFANCDAPLDRCMPKVRSVEIDVSATYLNALVECALLCSSRLTIPHALLQINNNIPTPIGLSEPSKRACLMCLRIRQPETRITSPPLSIICRALPRSRCLSRRIRPQCNVADNRSPLHQRAISSRTRADTRSRAHENFRGAYGWPQPYNSTGARRGALRTPGNAREKRALPPLNVLSGYNFRS